MRSSRKPERRSFRIVAGLLFGLLNATAATAQAPSQSVVDKAINAFRTGRYDEAIDVFQDRVRQPQAGSDDFRYFVRALAEVGRYVAAEDVAEEYIRTRPDSAELHNSLGEILWKTGRLDGAEEAFAEAVNGNAADALTAELNLAIAAFDRGRLDEAMQRFDRFIDVYNKGEAETAEDLLAVGIACRYLGINDFNLFHDSLLALDAATKVDPADLRPQLRIAELYLERYDSQSAQPELANVLRVNPHHPEALLAMARRLEFDGETEATQVVAQALDTNPNFVAAHVFRAHQLLTLERFDEAASRAEIALEINPSSLEALAALATAHYLNGDTAEFERARDRTLALNPLYAELYNTLADFSVQNRLYAQAVEFAEQAIELDPQSWRGYSVQGLNLLRIGDIEGGRQSLEISFAGDPFNVWVKNTLDLLDTFPDYVETRTARFILMTEGPEAELLSLYLGLLAEDAYDYFSERYQYAAPTPIRIEVYPSHADFSVRTVGLAGLGALGVSFGPVIAIDSPSARPLGEFNWGTTLWHEIGHTFTLGTTDFKIPRWFSEGLSVYEERRGRDGWGDDVTPDFLIAHLNDRLLPVGSITDGFMRPSYPTQVINSYYQASLICELIEREWGFDAILGLLDAYKAGRSTKDAFLSVLDVDLESFDDSFFAYVDELYAGPLDALRPMVEDAEEGPRSMPRARPSTSQLGEDADASPGDFMAQLAYGAALFDEDSYAEAVPYLEAAKNLFPDYAEANSPYWYLSRIAEQHDDKHRAADELSALVNINEKHYRAHIELARLREELGELDAAAEALERILYIYPMKIAMHQKLAALYDATEVHDLAVRERAAVVALVPVDIAEALFQLARAQFTAGDLAAAKKSVLGALEIAPEYPAAQDLLLDLVDRGIGGEKR